MRDSHRQIDRLTIARLMVLSAGVGVGLAVFGPSPRNLDAADPQWWRSVLSAVLIGFSLPGVWYAPRRRRRRRLAMGALLWLALGLGVLLLFPSALAERLLRGEELGSGQSTICLYFTLPMMSLWFTLAGVIGGHFNRRALRRASWTDRFGLRLALAWSVLGLWILGEIYWNAFFKAG